MKICSICKIEKPYSDFWPLKTAKDGCYSSCRPCSNLRQRQTRKRTEETALKEKQYREKLKDAPKPILTNKTCTKCGGNKDVSCFYKDNATLTGYGYVCKECCGINRSKYRDKILERKRLYRENNKDKIKQAARIYNTSPSGKKIRRQRDKKRLKNNPKIQIIEKARAVLRNIIKLKRNSNKQIALIGCSEPDFLNHLQGWFSPEMTWENYGSYWCIDHIIPIAAYNVLIQEELYKANHFTNLQPLTIEENNRKNLYDCKYIKFLKENGLLV